MRPRDLFEQAPSSVPFFSPFPGDGQAAAPGGALRPTVSRPEEARVFGVLYLITFVTSIPALFLYGPALRDPVG
jgi:hypothetical protein